MSLWHHHPAVRTGEQLTLGERAADRMRNGMGSWPFVFGFLTFMAAWAIVNTIVLVNGWDPYPYILLNLFLSMLAGLQGAILLIAAKRQDQIASELAKHDFDTNVATKEVVDAIHALTTEIHQRVQAESPRPDIEANPLAYSLAQPPKP